LRISANLSLLFAELPLLDRFEAARAAGFDAVEIQFPYAETIADLVKARDACGLPVVLINAPVEPENPAGLACRPERRAAFRAGLRQCGEYAEALGATRVNVLAGVTTGADASACADALAANLAEAAEVLARSDAWALVEFINRHDVPDYAVESPARALSLVEETGGKLGFLLDAYHLAMVGEDPVATFDAFGDRVGHIQFADAPGRREPGTGQAPLEPFMAHLAQCGYAGLVGAEYRPARTTAEGLGWLADWRTKFG
jgi:hydroxypyruvate isomerase